MIRILAITCEEALLSCRWLSTCLPMGSSGFPYFSLPVHEAFAFLVNSLYLNTQVFLFTLLIPLHIPLGESEQEAVWG